MLTISQSDAKAFDDFIRFAERHCYDEIGVDKVAKSRTLRLHLERMRMLVDTLIDYANEEIDFYWMGPDEMQLEEADPLLISEISGRSGLRFHRVSIYQLPDDILFGTLQVAVDEKAGETCGLVRIRQWPSDLLSGPRWTQNEANLDETIQAFVDAAQVD
ncbi:hypothetical protein [Rhizobium sp. 11_C7_N12_5]|uniref:hypothetical protein n=1 Tax=Rhizobium sp. 11_C7_N12_5 TaxID=3240770 RepID=UPI003F25638B